MALGWERAQDEPSFRVGVQEGHGIGVGGGTGEPWHQGRRGHRGTMASSWAALEATIFSTA